MGKHEDLATIIGEAAITQHVFVRDVETRSTIDLAEVGPYVYATHPSTEVLCVGYCVDDGPVKIWKPGELPPTEYKYAACDADWTAVAHNAQFEQLVERYILGPRFGFPIIPLEQNMCTMAVANTLALPAALSSLAKVLNLEHQKDVVGERVMQQLAKPRKPHKDESPDAIYWFDDDERMQKLYKYCGQDVETTREVAQVLPWLSPEEHAVWLLDQRINARGFYVDQGLAMAAQRIVAAAHPRINSELARITNDAVVAYTQVAKIKEWLADNGCPVDSLDKRGLDELLSSDFPEHLRRVIELRALGAQAAVAKVDALMKRREPDGRVRGAFVYHAAGTGRFSSRGAQVHNLKRSLTEDLEKAIRVIGRGDFEYACKHYDNPLSVIGDLVRAMICAAPGHTLIGGDFSGIEARVTAWIADEHKKLEVFRRFDRGEGPDPYIMAASQIFHLDPHELAVRYAAGEPEAREQRQCGKSSELAFGYGGGVGAYRKLAPDTTLSDDEIERVKRAWRRAHPNIERFWHSFNNAAWHAVRHRGDTVRCGKVSLFCDEQPILWLTLPSGRKLSYPNARIARTWTPPGTKTLIETKRGNPSLVFMDNSSGQWRLTRGYGGYWTENAVQAVARDLLTEAMLQMDDAGLSIVAHVHDSIAIEVPKKDAARIKPKFAKLMTTTPEWGSGIPIVAATWTGDRYVK